MFSIFKKEVNAFLSSLIGYVAIGIFLAITGAMLWVLPSETFNIAANNTASLSIFFALAPFVFLFLIPAITMRSFAEELQTGTIELLMTRPLSDRQIVWGKYLAALFLVVFSILPTLVYVYSVSALGAPRGNVDWGATWGSYLGLLGLGAVFVAIGIFASSLTRNQIVSFLLAFLLCSFFFLGFAALAKLPIFFGSVDDIVEAIGIDHHYTSISRGLVDTRDLVYFLSMIALFLGLTQWVVERRHR